MEVAEAVWGEEVPLVISADFTQINGFRGRLFVKYRNRQELIRWRSISGREVDLRFGQKAGRRRVEIVSGRLQIVNGACREKEEEDEPFSESDILGKKIDQQRGGGTNFVMQQE